MKKITTLFMLLCTGVTVSFAQSCYDEVEYVASKNIGGTTLVDLTSGGRYSVSQTYHYDGVGQISTVRVYGDNPHGHNHLMRVAIYNVDVNNRPTTMIAENWKNFSHSATWIDANFPNTTVTGNFALVVERADFGSPTYIKHTGNDGLGEDLTSYRTLGGNWQSLGLGGDLYIVPYITNNNTANFTANTKCIATGGSISFTDNSTFATEHMFNTITEPGYSGGQTLYAWDFGGLGSSTAQNPSFIFNTPGAHTVTLTTTIDDWNGSLCQDTYSMEVSVGLNVTGVGTDLTCNGDGTGTISLTGTNGAPPYVYYLTSNPYVFGATFTGLDAGTYSIHIKDVVGCEVTGSNVTINEPNGINVAQPVNTTLATCGNSDGAFVAFASGGEGTLMYSIDNNTYQANGSFTGVSAGLYKVYVLDDANDCVDSSTVVAVNNTAAPTMSLQQYITIACNGSSTGSITVLGTGGTGALQYSIDGINFQSSATFTGLPAGTYTPIVEDAAGCQGSTDPVILTEPALARWSVSSTPTLCYGSSDGEIEVGPVVGGTGSMSYSLNAINYQSSPLFQGLPAGLYNVTVKDGANCSTSSPVTVTQPTQLMVSIDSWTDLTCFESEDGEIMVSATGGTGNYSFQLNTQGAQTIGEFYGLAAGNYMITVKDENNCPATSSIALTQPTEIMATIVTGNSTCSNANGNVLVVANGGSGSGYTYDFDEGTTINTSGSFTGISSGEYGIYVTDANGCEANFTATVADSDGPSIAGYTSTDVTCNGGNDGSITIGSVIGGTGTILYSIDGESSQFTGTFYGLDAGIHNVLVTDANGCTGGMQITLLEPAPFTIVLTGTNISCYGDNDGSISVAAGGGAGTLAYSLDGVNFQSSPVFNNLTSGLYIVTVRDAGQCEDESLIWLLQPPAITMYANTLNVTCHGGSNGAIQANAIGGTGIIQFSIDGITYQTSGTFNNLPGGMMYTVYAKDANGCIKTMSVFVDEPDQLIIAASDVSPVSCAGGDNGVINISVLGGTAPYTYLWSTLASSEDIFNLESGIYSVSITDGNGCTISNNFIVTEPTNPIVINGTITTASGATINDGAVDITVSGGTVPYSFSWSNGSAVEDLTNLLPGVYVIIVTDANGCTLTTSFTVSFATGLPETYAETILNIYPNPASDIITIDFGSNYMANKIVLVDPAGKKVYETIPESEKIDIDVKFFAEGIYFINLYMENETITKKIIINKN